MGLGAKACIRVQNLPPPLPSWMGPGASAPFPEPHRFVVCVRTEEVSAWYVIKPSKWPPLLFSCFSWCYSVPTDTGLTLSPSDSHSEQARVTVLGEL